jgi:NADH dehydrogenase [ubiquinone] 1 alpha subcomplex assembly factor 5
MGESNADLSRQPFVSRDVFLAAAAAYDALYRDSDGFVDATFNVRFAELYSLFL